MRHRRLTVVIALAVSALTAPAAAAQPATPLEITDAGAYVATAAGPGRFPRGIGVSPWTYRDDVRPAARPRATYARHRAMRCARAAPACATSSSAPGSPGPPTAGATATSTVDRGGTARARSAPARISPA